MRARIKKRGSPICSMYIYIHSIFYCRDDIVDIYMSKRIVIVPTEQ